MKFKATAFPMREKCKIVRRNGKGLVSCENSKLEKSLNDISLSAH